MRLSGIDAEILAAHFQQAAILFVDRCLRPHLRRECGKAIVFFTLLKIAEQLRTAISCILTAFLPKRTMGRPEGCSQACCSQESAVMRFPVLCTIAVVSLVAQTFGSTDFLVKPGRAAQPVNMVVGPDNNLWFAETTGEKIGRITTAGVITEFPVPGAQFLLGITGGPDGNIWFTDQFTGKIGHISTGGTNLTQYSLPPGSYPQGITVGPDHALWFVDQKKSGLFTIGTITVAGQITEYPTNINVGVFQAESFEYAEITTGPDGNLWFTNPQAGGVGMNLLGKITTAGAVTTYTLTENPLAICAGFGNLWVMESTQVAMVTISGAETDYGLSSGGYTGITAGPDGNIWFTEAPNVVAYVVPSSGLVVEFGLDGQLSALFYPSSITSGPDGAIWFLGNFSSNIGRVTTSGTLTHTYALNHGSAPTWNTLGPDDAVWFTEPYDRIGRITTTGVVTTFPTTPNTGPGGIVAGPDGNLWFTEEGVGAVAKMTTSGAITEYPAYGVFGITAGPDGNLWFPEFNLNAISRITTSGIVTDFPLPTPSAEPLFIAAGPDGNLWFTETSASQVGKIDPTTGSITEYPLTPGRAPGAITAGRDGNLWFLENTLLGGVAKITTSGVVTEYPVELQGFPEGLVAGPDGALWFTQSYPNSLARITTSGVVSEVPLSTKNAAGNNLAVGADGKLWVAELFAGSIGRLSAIGGTGKTITALHGSVFEGAVATFVDGTPAASQADFTAIVNWGDGTSSAGTVAGATEGPFIVRGTHTYTNAGTFKLSVALTDNVDKTRYEATPGKAKVQ
jgi:streptogramin lyase